ncbi:MAG: hypothetical protein CMM93_00340 [Rickettsiales bacterium]|nr:hypothetical protein [Rickettsiales bacterium]
MNQIETPGTHVTQARPFKEILSSQPTLAGWRNPYADPASAEARATRLAEIQIHRLLDAMAELGYQPFTGVEVNFALNDTELLSDYVAHIKEETLKARQHVGFQQKQRAFRRTGWVQPIFLPGLPRKEAESGKWLRQLLDQALTITDEELPALTKDLELCLEGLTEWLNPALRTQLQVYCNDPAISSKPGVLNYYGFETIPGQDNEFYGKVHIDVKNVEVTTSASDPLTTIRRVNRIKSLAFQATHDYDQLYVGSLEELENPDSFAPIDPIAEKILNALGDHNIAFSWKGKGSTGEHLNFSLQAIDGPAQPANRLIDQRNSFVDNNIMRSTNIRELFTHIFLGYLSHDTLLGIGNLEDIKKYQKDTFGNPAEEQRCHEIRPSKNEGSGASSRIEIRTFNSASSNVTLSMLAVLSAAYAALLVIHEHPEIEEGVRMGVMQDNAKATICNAMRQRWPVEFNVRADVDASLARFSEHSVTLAMMRYLDEKAEIREDATETLLDCGALADRFEKTIYTRTGDMAGQHFAKKRIQPEAPKAEPLDNADESVSKDSPHTGPRRRIPRGQIRNYPASR